MKIDPDDESLTNTLKPCVMLAQVIKWIKKKCYSIGANMFNEVSKMCFCRKQLQ